jgi:hypothetical protein
LNEIFFLKKKLLKAAEAHISCLTLFQLCDWAYVTTSLPIDSQNLLGLVQPVCLFDKVAVWQTTPDFSRILESAPILKGKSTIVAHSTGVSFVMTSQGSTVRSSRGILCPLFISPKNLKVSAFLLVQCQDCQVSQVQAM